MNVAVVLAGGIGSRMGGDKPKQFMSLEGRCVIEHSIDVFEQCPGIDEVAVVVHPQWMDFMRGVVTRNHWSKVQRLVEGGSERYMSSLNAIEAYIDYPDETNLIFHDAARPWVSSDVVDRVIIALKSHSAVGVAVPSTDTVWEVHPDFGHTLSRFVSRIPDRRVMWRAQTPQAFRLATIRDAYQMAMQDTQFTATDDCGVVKRYAPNVKIHVVEGDERNKKITFSEDLL